MMRMSSFATRGGLKTTKPSAISLWECSSKARPRETSQTPTWPFDLTLCIASACIDHAIAFSGAGAGSDSGPFSQEGETGTRAEFVSRT
jgi:hypothetical protein